MSKVVRRDALKKVPFGRTGWQVTEVCAGSMTWGSFNGKEEEAFSQLDRIYELGVNFIDTAELYPVAFNYGKTTELWIGKWLKARKGKVDRKKLYIATKCNPAGIGAPDDKTGAHGFEEAVLEASCRASLERMGLDVIDLYQLHWPSRDTPVFGCAQFYPAGHNRPMKFVDMGPDTKTPTPADGGMAVFERQVKAVGKLIDKGLIKHWGLSNENAYGITMMCLAADRLGIQRPVSCQNDFSLVNRTYEADTWEACYRFGVVGLPYGALAGGVLTGKYHDGTQWADGGKGKVDPERPASESRMRVQKDFQPRYGMPAAMLATEKYIQLAEEYGITPTELALAWAKQRPCNASIIMGTTTVAQVEACVAAFKLDLPDELMAKVDAVHEELRNPSMYYCDKPVCMDAKWLKGKVAPASQVRRVGGAPTAAILAAAAAVAATCFVAMRR
jgi:aryl-alcohol dehydrogenase-like predicted oxidoreductase